MQCNLFLKINRVRTAHFKRELTIWGNHLLVIYAFIAPLHFNRSLSAIISILLVFFLIRGDYKFYLKEAFSNKIVQALVSFVIIHYVWMLGADNLNQANDILRNTKYYLYPILILSFADKSFTKRVVTAFILGMLFSELLSYLIHFEIMPCELVIFNTLIYKAQAINNPTPFLDHYFYNTFLSIVVALLLYNLLANSNTMLVKIVSIFFIVTASINMTLVGGRIGYLIYIFLIFFTLFFIYRKSFFKLVMPITIILIASFFYISYQSGGLFQERIDMAIKDKEKMLTQKNRYDSSIGARLGMWKYSMEVIKENFLFGVGTGDFMDEINAKIPDEHRYLSVYEQPHNEYIKYFVQFGVFGFLAFLNIFYQIFKTKADTKDVQVAIYVFGAAFAVVLSTNQFLKQILLLFILIIPVLTSKADFINSQYLQIKLKTVIFYTLAIPTLIVIDLLQR